MVTWDSIQTDASDACDAVEDHPILTGMAEGLFVVATGGAGLIAVAGATAFDEAACSAVTGLTRDHEINAKRDHLKQYGKFFIFDKEGTNKYPTFMNQTSYNHLIDDDSIQILADSQDEIYNSILESDYELIKFNDRDFELRRHRCDNITCSEDCNGDDNCYWTNTGGKRKDENKSSATTLLNETYPSCQCKPCVMVKDSITGVERKCAQKIVAKDFVDNKYQDYQDDCDNTNPIVKKLQGESNNSYCGDLTKLYLSQYILSSPSYDNIAMDDSMSCNYPDDTKSSDNADENRKKCKNLRIQFCVNDGDDDFCEHKDITYADLIKDTFSYYFLSDTKYGSKYHNTCYPFEKNNQGCYEIIDIGDDNNPIIDDAYMIYKNAEGTICDDNTVAGCQEVTLPAQCGDDNMLWIQGDIQIGQPYWDGTTYLPGCDSRDDDNIIHGIKERDKERIDAYINSLGDTLDLNGTIPIENRGLCLRKNVFIDDDNSSKCNTYQYCLDGTGYGTDAQFESCQENEPLQNNYNPTGGTDDQIYDVDICNSPVVKCMGYEVIGENKDSVYELILDSLYYIVPTKTSNIVPEWGLLRSYYALNDYYLGKTELVVPTGEILEFINNKIYSLTHDPDGSSAAWYMPELGDEGEEAADPSNRSAIESGVRDEDGSHLSADSGSLDLYRDRIKYDDKITFNFGFIRDWAILIFLAIVLLVVLVPLSFTVLPFLIVWSLTYVTYKRFYDDTKFLKIIVPVVFGVFLYMLIKIYGKL